MTKVKEDEEQKKKALDVKFQKLDNQKEKLIEKWEKELWLKLESDGI